MNFRFAKSLITMMSIGLLGLNQVHAQSQKLILTCHGTQESRNFHLEIFEGGFSDDIIILEESTAYGEVISTLQIPTKGGTFVGCGSRTDPCLMIESTNYFSLNSKVFFSMTSPLEAKYTQGTLSLDKKNIELECLK